MTDKNTTTPATGAAAAPTTPAKPATAPNPKADKPEGATGRGRTSQYSGMKLVATAATNPRR